MRKKFDFLVIGSGIAGLSYALKVAQHGKVCIVTKSGAADTATRYAQGGIAAVTYTPDTYEKHIKDTLIAGDDLNDENIVRITITESSQRIKELIEWGTRFDKTTTGQFDLGREGGHSEKRVLHHKDSTGLEIQQVLLHQARSCPNIEIYEDHFTIDIITQHHLNEVVTRRRGDIACFGAYVLDVKSNQIHTFLAKTTMLATGGAGNVYATTTNPRVATGDGVAMVYRAKGVVEKMEFIQFHPTALYNPKESPSFLITEALRGFGAVLKNGKGEEFMQKYDARASLAPRDIVARAIDNEMKLSGDDFLYLDCRHLDKNELINHFPTIYAKCLTLGIDISRDLIPVVPAAHYTCGGIKTDEFGRSSIEQLYASGECASTGLHGANRLASNSLLESLVFSHRASLDAASQIDSIDFRDDIPDWNAEGTVLNEEMILITQSLKDLQAIMSSYVGIVRSNLRLKRAFDRLEIIYRETEDLYEKSILTVKICELRNLINVAYLIIKMAMQRKESRGLHYSLDYPRMRPSDAASNINRHDE
ncbi:MAG: L-aspartate oxidase [Bacteroidales bacterium]|jgi:L-aspartate oxidase|nr:L-aspartate oxidase [Bacteroidales bacterium]NCU35296.1 L-aspartate oxidase [Candidatus Falkowbacteria bacterium]MDD2631378.1 L-aspartate oxidase [Bacteroidales bacterium]MDD3130799.1 L-aspartate oxidase [Bacteroidales bacterium]MDD4175858.1 L-aspartate oxidase [Bacteroidales bacterium]